MSHTFTPEEIGLIRKSVRLPEKHRFHIPTQHEMAALLNIAPDTWVSWEHGRRTPSGAAATLLALIRAEPKRTAARLAKLNRTAEK